MPQSHCFRDPDRFGFVPTVNLMSFGTPAVTHLVFENQKHNFATLSGVPSGLPWDAQEAVLSPQ